MAKLLIVALILGVAVLNLSSIAPMLLDRSLDLDDSLKWLVPASSQLGIFVFSLLGLAILARGRWRRYGFQMPQVPVFRSLLPWSTAFGIVAGVAISAAQSTAGATTELFTPLQTILFVWIFASVSEEIFARGLLQGYLAPLGERGFDFGRLRVSVPVLFAALFFGLMHLGLLMTGAPFVTVLPIVFFAFILGLLAGHYRELSGSLLPAVAVHFIFNVCASIIDWTHPF